MKLAVIIPTRSKPDLLNVVIGAFRHLASEENDIKFFVRIDNDEWYDYYDVFVRRAKPDTSILPLDAPLVPAEKVMDIINSLAFKEFDPDVHLVMSDDILPLTFHWDRIIAAVVNDNIHAFCWQEAGDPTNTGYIILSKKYVSAMASYLPLWFPFWFSDTWRAEVHQMAFGSPMPIIQNLCLGGRRGKTYGMQDVDFWFDFFAKTRKVRVKEAEILSKNFGLFFIESGIKMYEFHIWDESQKTRYKAYEQRFGGDHSPQYAEAKKRAEDYLLTL